MLVAFSWLAPSTFNWSNSVLQTEAFLSGSLREVSEPHSTYIIQQERYFYVFPKILGLGNGGQAPQGGITVRVSIFLESQTLPFPLTRQRTVP